VATGIINSKSLVTLNVEECGLAGPAVCKVLVDMIRKNFSLKSLKISGNKLHNPTEVFNAVLGSRIETLCCRKIFKGVANAAPGLEPHKVPDKEIFGQLILHLVSFDLRDNGEIDRLVADEICRCLAKTERLFSLKCPNLRFDIACEALQKNTSLGVLVCPTFQCGYREAASIGDNCSLFVMEPIPASADGNLLRAQLEANLQISKIVRKVIYLIIASRQFHREQCGVLTVFPKEIVILICKQLWNTRRERNVWRR
jgi:hypothetical protein